MSSWPWMKGCAVAIAEPSPPVNETDDRPAILPLIREHQDAIRQMRTELQSDPLYNPDKHDGLWIVRFLLSHKFQVAPAVKAAQYTLQYRQEHNLDETDQRPFPAGGRESRSEAVRRFMEYCQPGAMCQFVPDGRRGVVAYSELTGVDTHRVIVGLDESDWLPYLSHMAEWMHQWLDYVSRTTGRLTKSIRVVNLEGFTYSQWNREYSRRNRKVFAILEECYPQMLDSIFMCHAPAWVELPWRMSRRIIPKRIVEKIDFISPKKREEDKLKLLKFVDCDKLPERLGGSYTPWPVEIALPKTE